jgi:hypothetical protein
VKRGDGADEQVVRSDTPHVGAISETWSGERRCARELSIVKVHLMNLCGMLTASDSGNVLLQHINGHLSVLSVLNYALPYLRRYT